MATLPRFSRFASQNSARLHSIRRNYSASVDGSIPNAKQRFVPTAGTYPKGFYVSGTHVGIKPSKIKPFNVPIPDLALITSDQPCSAAAVFTTNDVQAAPVTVSREVLRRRNGKGIRSIIINSGCANAVTHEGGRDDANSMTAAVDDLQSDPHSTLVCSTGVIGQSLPIKKILDAIPKARQNLDVSHEAWLTTAKSICTTDTFPKLLSTTFTLPSSPNITYSIAGMAKGAGMINPNMATLLSVLCTDVPIAPPDLQNLLDYAVARSFNAISVDNSMSTNDTVAILANGAAGGELVNQDRKEDFKAMQVVITDLTQRLSQLVVRDGEGATKVVHLRVINSPSFHDSELIASSISKDDLVRTALYGKDANWGRILAAIGYTKKTNLKTFVLERTSVSFVPTDGSEPLHCLVNGEPEDIDEARAAQILAEEDIEILVDLGGGLDGDGREEAHKWFCDLSHEYVTINADYRT